MDSFGQRFTNLRLDCPIEGYLGTCVFMFLGSVSFPYLSNSGCYCSDGIVCSGFVFDKIDAFVAHCAQGKQTDTRCDRLISRIR